MTDRVGTALIDGDIVIYRMAFAVQKVIYTHIGTSEYFEGIKKAKEWFLNEQCWGDKEELKNTWNLDDWNTEDRIEPFPNCSFLIDSCINTIMKKTGANDCKIFLSPKRNFRHDVSTIREYKANRAPPPEYKDKARQYLIDWYGAEEVEGIEADDALGLAQDTASIICSNDKDLLQIPGNHFNFVDDVFAQVDIYEADNWFFVQLIAGDSTDNIQGIPGLGVAKAAKIVDAHAGDHAGLVEHITDLYMESYGHFDGQSIMYEMAQLVYILRRGDTLGENEQWRQLLSEPSREPRAENEEE